MNRQAQDKFPFLWLYGKRGEKRAYKQDHVALFASPSSSNFHLACSHVETHNSKITFSSGNDGERRGMKFSCENLHFEARLLLGLLRHWRTFFRLLEAHCKFIKLLFGSIVCSTNFSIFIARRMEKLSQHSWGQKKISSET